MTESPSTSVVPKLLLKLCVSKFILTKPMQTIQLQLFEEQGTNSLQDLLSVLRCTHALHSDSLRLSQQGCIDCRLTQAGRISLQGIPPNSDSSGWLWAASGHCDGQLSSTVTAQLSRWAAQLKEVPAGLFFPGKIHVLWKKDTRLAQIDGRCCGGGRNIKMALGLSR